jgi:hypothetical protein
VGRVFIAMKFPELPINFAHPENIAFNINAHFSSPLMVPSFFYCIPDYNLYSESVPKCKHMYVHARIRFVDAETDHLLQPLFFDYENEHEDDDECEKQPSIAIIR